KWDQPEQAAQNAGFARAVGTGERHRLSGGNFKGQFVEHTPPTQLQADAFEHHQAHDSTLLPKRAKVAPRPRSASPASIKPGRRDRSPTSHSVSGGCTKGDGSVSLGRGANSGNSRDPRSMASAAEVPEKNASSG